MTLNVITQADRDLFIHNAKLAIKATPHDTLPLEKIRLEYLAYNSRRSINAFWPNPVHPKTPRSQYDLLPLVPSLPKLSRLSNIVSAGSCFAFEMSRRLQLNGFNYYISEKQPSRGLILGHTVPSAPIQLYNFSAFWGIHQGFLSLRYLIDRSFCASPCKYKHSTPPMLLGEFPSTSGSVYVDPFREGVAFSSPSSYLEDYPKHSKACLDAFQSCDMFIYTVGVNESWIDDASGYAYSHNACPTLRHLSTPVMLSHEANCDAFDYFYRKFRKINPSALIVLTVSPLPINATVTMPCVITANQVSKSILRSVVHAITSSSSYHGVHYFPSYEYVLSCQSDPFTSDTRHVKPEVADRIFQFFTSSFFAPYAVSSC